MSAISSSPGRRPARASTTSIATSASASASRAWSWIETASGSSSSRSTPPVSISVKWRPFQSVGELLAVARDARALVHDRLARLGEPVDERGLARRWGSRRRRSSSDLPRLDDAAWRSARRPRRSAEPGRVDGRRVGRRLVHGAVGGRVALVALAGARAAPWRGRRRRARRRGAWRAPPREAVRNTFTAASGATTEPMSRPSATQSPCSRIARCLAISASRTPGSAATRDAPADTSGVRIAVGDVAAVEQHPRRPTSMSIRSRDLGGRRRPARVASATARYIAPVSRYVKPSRSATARATVDLPAPAGPSIAITMASEARRGGCGPCRSWRCSGSRSSSSL